MPLSEPRAGRTPNHLRTITIESFDCEDGCLEIEAKLGDQKRFACSDRERGRLAPGRLFHGISVRVRIDRSATVLAAEAALDDVPFAFCSSGATHLAGLVGKRIDEGWRRTVNEAIGGTKGCAHLRELLIQLATVSFQTAATHEHEALLAAGRTDLDRQQRPFFINGCSSWSDTGPVVEHYMPQFAARPGTD